MMTDPIESIREFRAIGDPPGPHLGRRRRPHTLAVAAVLVLGALAVGVALQMRTGDRGEDVAAREPVGSETTLGEDGEVPSDPEGVVAMARRAASRTGEESPTGIEWVYSNREAAVMHVAETYLADAGDDAVLVVQMRGDFEVEGAHQGPPPVEGEELQVAPTGGALVIVVELASGITTDRLVLPGPVDLSPLGDVTMV